MIARRTASQSKSSPETAAGDDRDASVQLVAEFANRSTARGRSLRRGCTHAATAPESPPWRQVIVISVSDRRPVRG